VPPRAASIVLWSSDPSGDAKLILRLLPGRFVRVCEDGGSSGNGISSSAESSSSSGGRRHATRCVTLVGGSDGDATSAALPPTSTAIIFVNVGLQNPPPSAASISSTAESSNDMVAPSATLILSPKDADLIASIANNNDFKGGTIRSSGYGDGLWVLIRLSGGGGLLLASSMDGLYHYAESVASDGSRDGQINEEGRDRDALTEVDIGKEGLPAPAKATAPAVASTAASVDEPPYKFPSLALSILSNKDIIPGFQCNTRVGVPIESDLFVGKVLLIMRPPHPSDDPFYNEKVFSKKRRRFEIQIQGRFKYVPSGTVWCGFEVTEEMKLGLVSKGLCNLLLRLVSKTVPGDMHFSFGDTKNEELPHISFPAWTLFDKVVVTKPGEEPPPLGEVLPESAKESSARKRSASTGDWNTEDTYSFSYHSMYLDLPIWHVVNLPTSDIDLKSFWRDSLLRIVVYENNDAQNSKHLQSSNRYIAGIQAEYLGFDDQSINDMIEEQDALPLDQNRLSHISRSISYVNIEEETYDGKKTGTPLSPESDGLGWDNSTIESDEETTFYDATGVPSTTSSETELLSGGQVFVEMNSFDGQVVETVETNFVTREMPSNNILLYDMLCPAWIDVCSEQRGKYAKAYAFATGDEKVVLRTASEFGELFSVANAKLWCDEHFSPRLSTSEKHRRMMGYTLAACRSTPSVHSEQRCHALQHQKDCRFNNVFLQRDPPSSTDAKAKARGREIIFACYVGRALSERQWVEEWALITDQHVSFFHPDSKRPSFRISLKGILGVRELRYPAERPFFPSYFFVAIETISREIYLMFRSRDDCEQVLAALVKYREGQDRIPPSMAQANLSRDIALMTFDDPTEEYLHKSSVYSCKQRRLLNNRKFAFNSLGKIGFDDREGADCIHPLTLVQIVLRKALQPMDEQDTTALDEFLDAASRLKTANLSGLGETVKCAFLINLYHVMVMHGFLLFGTPLNSFKFVNHFNMIAYEVGDDIFSLTELEHNIIRANMSSPSGFLSKFVLPKSVYKKHALKKGDFRINFAINCGSISSPEKVQVFTSEDLDAQLDTAAKDYLEAAKVSSSGKTLTLPKICQWYSNDFGRGRSVDVVRLSAKYLSEDDENRLSTVLSDVHIRHYPFEFKCRPLKLRNPGSDKS